MVRTRNATVDNFILLRTHLFARDVEFCVESSLYAWPDATQIKLHSAQFKTPRKKMKFVAA